MHAMCVVRLVAASFLAIDSYVVSTIKKKITLCVLKQTLLTICCAIGDREGLKSLLARIIVSEIFIVPVSFRFVSFRFVFFFNDEQRLTRCCLLARASQQQRRSDQVNLYFVCFVGVVSFVSKQTRQHTTRFANCLL